MEKAVVVHLVMVVLSGPIRQTWGMIAGGRVEEDVND